MPDLYEKSMERLKEKGRAEIRLSDIGGQADAARSILHLAARETGLEVNIRSTEKTVIADVVKEPAEA